MGICGACPAWEDRHQGGRVVVDVDGVEAPVDPRLVVGPGQGPSIDAGREWAQQ